MSIWSYTQFENIISKTNQLSLGEGDTDLSEYTINDKKVLVKKEYQNPNHSFKDRSLAFQISKLKQNNIKEAVISSSGNAAISALAYSKLADVKLYIYVSNKIEEKKLEALNNSGNTNFELYKSNTPKSDAIQHSKKLNIPNLRGSTDEDAVVGFKTISYELHKQNNKIDAIYIPCSSGTSTLGIFHGYQDLMKIFPNVSLPQIHIIQTQKIHPIAKDFDRDFLRMYTSLAPAISDRVAHRKSKIVEIVQRTKGWGWVISDDELKDARELATKSDIDFLSYNSLLSLAGYLKAQKNNFNSKYPCLLFSGT